MVSSARAGDGSLGEPKMLIYGNYCGPGNNAPKPPIDALDAACARHDSCTPTGAMPTPTCNARLEQEAAAIARDPRQPPDLRMMADFVAAGAKLLQATNELGISPAAMPSTPMRRVAIRP
ncbi:hypothetical protein MKL11_20795 [Methylobacterium sp. J-077]|nr:hypothetical protein [Methylobacterium sp. J-077]MCJ2124949.1 hypothetical protein [Methylobacterium sp. J-077]